MHIPVWYIPSFFGDIRLIQTGPASCKVITENLTTNERAALDRLQAMAAKKKWLTRPKGLDWMRVTELNAPVEKVAGVLARALKPGRKVISAVKFSDGTFEEVRTAAFEDAPPPKDQANGGPYREPVQPPSQNTSSMADRSRPKEPEAATSVAAPYRGCPFPDFDNAAIRARRVLTAFLDADQIGDFERFNRFISVGQTTGHRYLITSRHANDELAKRRTVLYDVDDSRSICTHDWEVPAAEEMLALHVCLQIPGGERALRSFPGDIFGRDIIYSPDDLVVQPAVRHAVNRILWGTEHGKATP